MYSSFNRFEHNVYRDATIVTTLDTFTSMLAGFTIFGILGHLAHETGTTDIAQVVKGTAEQENPRTENSTITLMINSFIVFRYRLFSLWNWLVKAELD